MAALDPDDRGAAHVDHPQAVLVGLDLAEDDLARDLAREHVERGVGRLGEALKAPADQRKQRLERTFHAPNIGRARPVT